MCKLIQLSDPGHKERVSFCWVVCLLDSKSFLCSLFSWSRSFILFLFPWSPSFILFLFPFYLPCSLPLYLHFLPFLSSFLSYSLLLWTTSFVFRLWKRYTWWEHPFHLSLFLQILCSWTYPSSCFYLKHTVSKTGFCLCLQVEPT
jgi:hypothetical protein